MHPPHARARSVHTINLIVLGNFGMLLQPVIFQWKMHTQTANTKSRTGPVSIFDAGAYALHHISLNLNFIFMPN